jgi:hypothetical protein
MSTDRKVAHNWDDGREEVSAEHTRLEAERDQYKNHLDAIRALLGAPPQEFHTYLMKVVELSANNADDIVKDASSPEMGARLRRSPC